MAANSFGEIFRITTWGESHGKAIGVVIDGCPSGLELKIEDINVELQRRRPGQSIWTTPRKELDSAEILSGVFEGVTTGTPISLIIYNQDSRPEVYKTMRDVLRPGHANFTYLEKYGIFDYRGGGRASGRETACRVAAGAIAKKILDSHGIEILAYLEQVGDVCIPPEKIHKKTISELKELLEQSEIFCPDLETKEKMCCLMKRIIEEGDSIGGIVGAAVNNLPVGLGEPLFNKLDAVLAHAMLSIPASKGFEIGEGFRAAQMRGSEHNDLFVYDGQKIKTQTQHAGGLLGGLTSGMPLYCRVAFKPPSSIHIPQESVDIHGNPATLNLPEGSRHDPCLAIRAVPVVEAMLALVLVDALLLNRLSQLKKG